MLGRCTPDLKAAFARELKEESNVAVVCTKYSDLHALQNCDIGICCNDDPSCGAIKEHADIILVNQNLETLLLAIAQGRGVYSSIRKFI